jgi:putative endonuclease
MDRHPAVYILTNQRNGTLYIGVTSNLPARVWHHRQDLVPGFSRRYGTHMLVYFEMHATMEAAITREKQLKEWRRAWKLRLIESANPLWRDLWSDINCG